MEKNVKIVVVMPAYNAARTLEKTYRDIPKGLADEIILVDDGSSDATVKRAHQLGITVFTHKKNLGYGANQKTCYKEALRRKPDIVVMIHPDYQYDSSLTHELVRPIIEGRVDIMLGSRIRTRREALDGGMPLYKYFSNRILTLFENIILGLNLSEFHTGFRAYKREVLEKIPFNLFSNDFVFDQQILITAAYLGYRIGDIPVPVRYFPEASSINLSRSIIYGVSILYTLFAFTMHKYKIKKFKMFEKK